jgi:hypothetical protein
VIPHKRTLDSTFITDTPGTVVIKFCGAVTKSFLLKKRNMEPDLRAHQLLLPFMLNWLVSAKNNLLRIASEGSALAVSTYYE